VNPVLRACHDLAARSRFGALATLARDPSGWPFVTLVAVAFDERWRPLLLLSRLAEHTKNLEESPRASLLVSAGSLGAASPGAVPSDPLAAGRMTLVGECARGPAGEVRDGFLAAHPEAAAYADFADFAFWRIEVAHVRWVGGFGRMEWLSGAEYGAALAGS